MKQIKTFYITLTLLCLAILAGKIIAVSIEEALDVTPAVETHLTVKTDSDTYALRDTVTLTGNITIDGSPAENALVSIEIRKPDLTPLLYRTIPIGAPNETWVLQVQTITLFDLNWNPIDTVKTGNTVFFGVKVYNPLIITRNPVIIVISIVDGNNVPIASSKVFEGSIAGNTAVGLNKTFYIPTFACPGEAAIYVNVYDKLPSEGGVPYTPETYAKFYISRLNQGLQGEFPLQVNIHNSSLVIGSYETYFKLSHSPKPGDYSVTSVARFSPTVKSYGSTMFEVIDLEYPPQASFTYSPLQPYPNQTVTFDASASTAEGYGDVIIRYEWDFGDGTPKVIMSGNQSNPPSPIATHEFMAAGQYIVTLNVTDTEGYWSITQKPIYVKSPNPIAEFTWYPSNPRLNASVTFNASMSQPGWSIPNAAPAPIVLYMWDFNDTTPIVNTTNPIIEHSFTEPGNFTVTLTVVDSENQVGSVTYIITVINATSPIYDINGDGKVDIRDVAIVAHAFGTSEGDPNWDPRADITGPTGEPDGKVDIRDVALVAFHFGEIV